VANILNVECEVYNHLWEKVGLYTNSKAFVASKLFQAFRKDINKVMSDEAMKTLNVWLKPFLSGCQAASSHYQKFFEEEKSDLASLAKREVTDLGEYANEAIIGWGKNVSDRLIRSVKETIFVRLGS
jgi:hypothetical protein